MAKKKNKKKKKNGFLYDVDRSLNAQYSDLKDEIEYLQMEWDRANRKAKKKSKKKMKKKGWYPYDKEVNYQRKKVIKSLEDSDLLTRAEFCLEDIRPMCIIIARLIAALIVSILSIDIVKKIIKPGTLSKMEKVYKLAMSV